MVMKDIKLDPTKLLGFKIVAASGSVAKLHSPKIGGKQCPGIDAQGNGPAGLERPKPA